MEKASAFSVPAGLIAAQREHYAAVLARRAKHREQGIATTHEDAPSLTQLGNELRGLLPPVFLTGLLSALWAAHQRRRRLTVVLSVSPEARPLLALPWELMTCPDDAVLTDALSPFLLLNPQVSLVRQVHKIGRAQTPLLSQPLNLHAIAASPVCTPPCPIDTTATFMALQAVLGTPVATQRWYADHATLTALQARLIADQPDILHLLCHGQSVSDTYLFRHTLLLTDRDGRSPHPVDAIQLASVCALAPTLQVVVLQSCHSGVSSGILPQTASSGAAAADESDEEKAATMQRRAAEGLALTLIRAGIPMVVAMQGAVSQAAADTFVTTFYQSLQANSGVEAAVAHARLRMHAIHKTADWSLPVIYQGSGLPTTSTWYYRLAERVIAVLFDAGGGNTLRAGAIAVACGLLVVGCTRLLTGNPGSALPRAATLPPLVLWSATVLLIAGIVAATHRGVRARDDIPLLVRPVAVRAQWVGAVLGAGFAGGSLLLGLGVLWSLGMAQLLGFLPALPVLWIGLGTGWVLLLSYSFAVQQEQVFSILPEDRVADYPRATFGLLLFGGVAIILSPLILYVLAAPLWGWLLTPVNTAFVLAALLLLFSLLFKR